MALLQLFIFDFVLIYFYKCRLIELFYPACLQSGQAVYYFSGVHLCVCVCVHNYWKKTTALIRNWCDLGEAWVTVELITVDFDMAFDLDLWRW